MVISKMLLLKIYNKLFFLLVYSYFTYFIFLNINAKRNGIIVTNTMFIKPNINFNIDISLYIDIKIKIVIPIKDSGVIINPINKNIGDNDFRFGHLVIFSV